jgi:thiamine biosynthesis lipoprotein
MRIFLRIDKDEEKIVHLGLLRKTMLRFISIIAFVMPLLSCNSRAEYTTLQGFALGTTYSIKVEKPAHITQSDLSVLVMQAFNDIDFSLSVYNKESIISKVNRNEPVELDTLFLRVFERGKEVYTLTQGAFDMAAAPYFDLWGFGFKHKEQVTQTKLDSIALFAGMDKIWLTNGKVVKSDPRVSLNGNAIAKGYCSDVISSRLQAVGVKNLLVEVGGEIYCSGVSDTGPAKGKGWSIGVDRPEYGNLIPCRDLKATLLVSNRGLATSGNYRNYYEEGGQKYGHTIDPSTGKPVQHSLLSATVLATDCISADAFATAFMVMGLEKTKNFLESHPQIDAYLIYSDQTGAFLSFATQNITFINTY